MEIRDFQERIRQIYFLRDKKRGADKTYLWFLEEVGELTRAYRRGERKNIGPEMADVMAWLASMANLLNVDLAEELARKYPGNCSLCRSNPCRCPFA